MTHHLRHNRVLHERVLLINIVSSDAPRISPEQRVKLVPVGAGITRVILQFGFMEHPNVMDGLRLASRNADLRDIVPEEITYYFRRVMVIPSGKVPGMAVWRERLFAAMHLNANLPAAYFGVPTAQVIEVGLEVESDLRPGPSPPESERRWREGDDPPLRRKEGGRQKSVSKW